NAHGRSHRWCPSIACMQEQQRDVGRVLIESVNASQMVLGKRQSVEQTGGDSMTQDRLGPDRPRRSGRCSAALWGVVPLDRYYEGPGGCLSGTIIVSHTHEEEMDHGAPYDPSGSDSGTSLHDGVIRGIGAQ